MALWIALLFSCSEQTFVATAFSTQQQQSQRCHPSSSSSSSWSYRNLQLQSGQHQSAQQIRSRHPTSLSVIGPGTASILAGSVGGAIGVGIAYPLDTLKTKSQVYGQQRAAERRLQKEKQPLPPPGTAGTQEEYYPIESPEEDLISLVKLILEVEGVAGFFGGVKAMMIGQALIKSVAFGANAFALRVLVDSDLLGVANDVGSSGAGVDDVGAGAGEAVATGFTTLILAAFFSGFVTSFLVAPVERVKVMMQAQQNSLYANELECIRAVLQNEGWTGLFSRGLGPTLAREVPSYAIYFVVYGLLMQTSTAEDLGSVAPLICGAISGCACWIPVYPVDVVKTLVQNTEGGDSDSAVDVAVKLYKDEGIGAFFNGLTPKMLRASVNHAVTFYVYDLMMGVLV